VAIFGEILLILVGKGGIFELLRYLNHVGLFWEMAGKFWILFN